MSDSLIKGDQVAVEAMSFPSFRSGTPKRTEIQSQKKMTDALANLRRQAWKEGLEAGRQEGVAQIRRELGERVTRMDGILSQLAKPLAGLDGAIEEQAVKLIITIAKFLIRREIREQPGEIASVVRDALNALPVTPRSLQIFLNPEDASLVTEYLHLRGGESRWQLVEDIRIARGGCRLETEDSLVDATLDSRINAIVVQIMGGSRQDD